MAQKGRGIIKALTSEEKVNRGWRCGKLKIRVSKNLQSPLAFALSIVVYSQSYENACPLNRTFLYLRSLNRASNLDASGESPFSVSTIN